MCQCVRVSVYMSVCVSVTPSGPMACHTHSLLIGVAMVSGEKGNHRAPGRMSPMLAEHHGNREISYTQKEEFTIDEKGAEQCSVVSI